MAERWTKQRRLEHTRNVLLDAAEEVFARKGFDGAALEDIAAGSLRDPYGAGGLRRHPNCSWRGRIGNGDKPQRPQLGGHRR